MRETILAIYKEHHSGRENAITRDRQIENLGIFIVNFLL